MRTAENFSDFAPPLGDANFSDFASSVYGVVTWGGGQRSGGESHFSGFARPAGAERDFSGFAQIKSAECFKRFAPRRPQP